MGDELFDEVDENNNPTGKVVTRSKVHAEGTWHRVVHIYLFRKRGRALEFLVHLRSPLKDLAPNKWDVRLGGHVSAGKSLEETTLSELKEEIGMDIGPGSLIEGKWEKRDKFPNRELTKIYFLEFNGDVKDLNFNDGEVRDVKWLGSDDILMEMKNNPNSWTSSVESFSGIVEDLKNITT